jgi:hypothetical protein
MQTPESVVPAQRDVVVLTDAAAMTAVVVDVAYAVSDAESASSRNLTKRLPAFAASLV